jgi:hypothetical protein
MMSKKKRKKKAPRPQARQSIIELGPAGSGSAVDYVLAVGLFLMAGWLGGF